MQQRSNANPSGGSPVPDILAAWRMHVQGLARLAMAENLSHIDSSKAMLMGPEDKLPFIRIAASGPTVNHRYLEEAVKAAMNCMRLIMQKKDSFLFLSCSSAGLLTSVWGDITHFLLCFYDNRSQGLANGTSARLFAALTGESGVHTANSAMQQAWREVVVCLSTEAVDGTMIMLTRIKHSSSIRYLSCACCSRL